MFLGVSYPTKTTTQNKNDYNSISYNTKDYNSKIWIPVTTGIMSFLAESSKPWTGPNFVRKIPFPSPQVMKSLHFFGWSTIKLPPVFLPKNLFHPVLPFPNVKAMSSAWTAVRSQNRWKHWVNRHRIESWSLSARLSALRNLPTAFNFNFRKFWLGRQFLGPVGKVLLYNRFFLGGVFFSRFQGISNFFHVFFLLQRLVFFGCLTSSSRDRQW